MKTVVFCSFKGGTAKTSTCMHLGSALAKYHNKKILLIDYDSQSDLSEGIGLGLDCEDTIGCVLKGRRSIKDVIRETSITNLHAIPSDTYLDGIESSESLVRDCYAHERLRHAINTVKNNYDYIFIDIPPSLGWLCNSAFYAADYSLICAVTEPYSFRALNRLKMYHEAISKHHHIKVAGVLLSFWDARLNTNEQFLKGIENTFPELLFETRVRRDISVWRSILKKQTIFDAKTQSNASIDYKNLALEFLNRTN